LVKHRSTKRKSHRMVGSRRKGKLLPRAAEKREKELSSLDEGKECFFGETQRGTERKLSNPPELFLRPSLGCASGRMPGGESKKRELNHQKLGGGKR